MALRAALSTAAVSAEELRGLLHRRLRVVATVVACAATTFLLLVVSGLAAISIDHHYPWVVHVHGGVSAAMAGVAAALWLLDRPSERTLRRLELAMLAGTCGLFVLQQYIWFAGGWPFRVAAPGEERTVTLMSSAAFTVRWAVVIALYGVIIPNTGRRCATVVAAMAASALGSSVAAAAAEPSFRPLLPMALAVQAMGLAGSSVAAVFGSARLADLSGQAARARELGQYRLTERLGVGGMGEVWLAEHRLLRRPCAVKLIRPEARDDAEALARFEREVRATAALTHPNTVEVYDYGRADDGTFYYVMERLEGLSLAAMVKRTGPLPAGRAVYLLRQVCGALAEAHAAGMIHRDIKPGNVMACVKGGVGDVAKLLDFGLVSAVRGVAAGGAPAEGPDGERLTQAATVVGTPEFMSPEQATGRPDIDARSDLYALGAVGCYLLTGQVLFPGRNTIQTMFAHVQNDPPRPSSVAPGGAVPADLEDVLLRCLAKNPAARWPDAASLEAALAGCRCAAEWSAADAAAWWREWFAGRPPPPTAGNRALVAAGSTGDAPTLAPAPQG
jgi:serine/threonine-protein kinase